MSFIYNSPARGFGGVVDGAVSKQVRQRRPYKPLQLHAGECQVIGRVPKVMVLVKLSHIKRRGGYDLEIPCEYSLINMGDHFSIEWLKTKLTFEGH